MTGRGCQLGCLGILVLGCLGALCSSLLGSVEGVVCSLLGQALGVMILAALAADQRPCPADAAPLE